jgi:hypothetical protein
MNEQCPHGLLLVAICDDCDRSRPIEMIRQLRDTLGLFSGAMPRSPSEVWIETLRYVKAFMRDGRTVDVPGHLYRCGCGCGRVLALLSEPDEDGRAAVEISRT